MNKKKLPRALPLYSRVISKYACDLEPRYYVYWNNIILKLCMFATRAERQISIYTRMYDSSSITSLAYEHYNFRNFVF